MNIARKRNLTYKYLLQARNKTDSSHVPHRWVVEVCDLEELQKKLEQYQDTVDVLGWLPFYGDKNEN